MKIKYFSNYFVDNDIRSNKYLIYNIVFNDNDNKNNLSTLEYIHLQQFIVNDNNKVQIVKNMKDLELLYNICYEYSNNIKWIINNNPLHKNI